MLSPKTHPSLLTSNPNFITVLRPADPSQKVAKQFYLDDQGKVKSTAYDNVYKWLQKHADVSSLESILALLQKAQEDPCVLISGDHREAPNGLTYGAVTRTISNFAPVPRNLMPLDIDDFPTSRIKGWNGLTWDERAQAVFKSVMPPRYHGVGYVWQWSSSMAVKNANVAKIHFFLLLDRALDAVEHRYLHALLDGRRLRKQGKAKKGYTYALTGRARVVGYDPAPVRSQVQVTYITAPTFSGIDDPFEGHSRLGISPGERFSLKEWESELDRRLARDADLVSALRSGIKIKEVAKAHLEALILAGGVGAQSHRVAARLKRNRQLEAILEVCRGLEQGSKTNYLWRSVAPRLVFGGFFEFFEWEEILNQILDALEIREARLSEEGHTRDPFDRDKTAGELAAAIAMIWPFERDDKEQEQDSKWTEYQGTGRYLDAAILREQIGTAKTVVIKSPMGSGKTEIVKAIIAQAGDKRVVVASHLRSLVSNTATRLDLDHYEDDAEKIRTSKRVATTIHSLHKLEVDKNTILVIDESESAIEAGLSTVNDRPLVTWRGLLAHLKAAETVYLLDAHAGENTERLLGYSGREGEQVWIDNPWRPAKKAEILYSHATTYQDQQVALGLRVVEATGKRVGDREGVYPVAVVSTTKAELDLLVVQVSTAVPGSRVLLVSSETSEDEAVLDFKASPNDQLNQYDLVLMSPSVQSGVSIDVPVSFLAAFGQVGDWTTPQGFAQQIGRCRYPEETVIALDFGLYYAEDDAYELEQEAVAAIREAVRGTVLSGRLSGTVESWGVELPDSVFDSAIFKIRCQEEAHRNSTINAYVEEFERLLIEEEGYMLSYSEVVSDKEAVGARKKAGKQAKEAKIEAAFVGMSAQEVPSSAEFEALSAKKQSLTVEERHQLNLGRVAQTVGEAPAEQDLRAFAADPELLKKASWYAYFAAHPDIRALIVDKRAWEAVSKRDFKPLEFFDKDPSVKRDWLYKVLEASTLDIKIREMLADPTVSYCPAEYFGGEKSWKLDNVRALYGDRKLPTMLEANPVRFLHDIAAQFGLKLEKSGQKDVNGTPETTSSIERSVSGVPKRNRVHLYSLNQDSLALVERFSAGYQSYLQDLPQQIAEQDLLASLQGSLQEDSPGICGFASSLKNTTPQEAGDLLTKRLEESLQRLSTPKTSSEEAPFKVWAAPARTESLLGWVTRLVLSGRVWLLHDDSPIPAEEAEEWAEVIIEAGLESYDPEVWALWEGSEAAQEAKQQELWAGLEAEF